jgi:hypothetical protein
VGRHCRIEIGNAPAPVCTESGVIAMPCGVAWTATTRVTSVLKPRKQRLTFTVPVQNLPIGSRISKVEVTPNGLLLAATADNVKFNELPKA